MALTNKLSAIGDAIREKGGTTEKLTLDAMPTAIANLPIGGGSEGGSGADEKILELIGEDVSGDVVIPEEVTSLKSYMFYGNENMTSITFPKNFTKTGREVFEYCFYLKTIDMSKVVGTTLTLGAMIISRCNNLETIILPPNLTTLNFLGGSFIENCPKLHTIVIPQNLEYLPEGFLYGSNNGSMLSITLPGSLTGIHYQAFYSSGLRDIYVPWGEGEIAGAPWGATYATIHYNYNGG